MSSDPLNRGKHERTDTPEVGADDAGATQYRGDRAATTPTHAMEYAPGDAARRDHRDQETADYRSGGAVGPADPADERRAVGHRTSDDLEARERYGGINWGSAFFGWLVAIAVTVLASSVVAAVASAVGSATDFSQTQAQRDAGAVGLGRSRRPSWRCCCLGYYAGGYVAGRMSRYDGAKQGLAVWVIRCGRDAPRRGPRRGVRHPVQRARPGRPAAGPHPRPTPPRRAGSSPGSPSSSARCSPRCSAAGWVIATTTRSTGPPTAEHRLAPVRCDAVVRRDGSLGPSVLATDGPSVQPDEPPPLGSLRGP